MVSFRLITTLLGKFTVPIAQLQPYSTLPTLSPVVDLGYSQYEGYYDATYGLNIYKGIRYAAPPVGRLRWQLPQRPAQNRSQVIPATEYAPQCPQSGPAPEYV
ncbi:hypothetical protein GGS23DRAFT_579252 [Durotheca rogersii]|uniref:uncharacterized protein n=1 Tax=Durotheca rogersii TaxID=419775 RepID=UPI00221F1A7D|nr:uncharacterized protein GGS23DRAFT_579252 [Durotheca rogersii]KAI5860854.1 hypothetical protein GGS23DRAFT_579252 [Durotheca rogersii]